MKERGGMSASRRVASAVSAGLNTAHRYGEISMVRLCSYRGEPDRPAPTNSAIIVLGHAGIRWSTPRVKARRWPATT